MKLITDTCSAIKLLAFGDKLFKPGVLKSGDIVIHSRVFRETNKWDKSKKLKYKKELADLVKIGNKGANLSVPRTDFEAQEVIVKATIQSSNLSVGSGDIEQLVSALYHDLKVVTDDGHFNQLAGDMGIDTFDAEDIVIEARSLQIISQQEIDTVKKIWKSNNEKSQGKL